MATIEWHGLNGLGLDGKDGRSLGGGRSLRYSQRFSGYLDFLDIDTTSLLLDQLGSN